MLLSLLLSVLGCLDAQGVLAQNFGDSGPDRSKYLHSRTLIIIVYPVLLLFLTFFQCTSIQLTMLC